MGTIGCLEASYPQLKTSKSLEYRVLGQIPAPLNQYTSTECSKLRERYIK